MTALDYKECPIIIKKDNRLSLNELFNINKGKRYKIVHCLRNSNKGAIDDMYLIANPNTDVHLGKYYDYVVYTGKRYCGKGKIKVRNILDINNTDINISVPSITNYFRKSDTYSELR